MVSRVGSADLFGEFGFDATGDVARGEMFPALFRGFLLGRMPDFAAIIAERERSGGVSASHGPGGAGPEDTPVPPRRNGRRCHEI